MTDAERITRLEERLAHLQQHLTAQDKAMLEMHEELVALRRDLVVAHTQIQGSPTAGPGPEAERPPHF